MPAVRIKICGLTNQADAELAITAGADLLGFIFVPDTPRYLRAEKVAWISELKGAETVGVFWDAPLTEVLDIRRRLSLDRIQLHGNEPDEQLDVLGPRTLRRIDPRKCDLWTRVHALSTRCLPLVDPGGGSGLAADWQTLAADRPSEIEFGLAGGLHPDNVAAAVQLLRPTLVDVSSGVELRRRVKDPAKVHGFIDAVRSA